MIPYSRLPDAAPKSCGRFERSGVPPSIFLTAPKFVPTARFFPQWGYFFPSGDIFWPNVEIISPLRIFSCRWGYSCAVSSIFSTNVKIFSPLGIFSRLKWKFFLRQGNFRAVKPVFAPTGKKPCRSGILSRPQEERAPAQAHPLNNCPHKTPPSWKRPEKRIRARERGHKEANKSFRTLQLGPGTDSAPTGAGSR